MFETVPPGYFTAERQNVLERRMSALRGREKGGDFELWVFDSNGKQAISGEVDSPPHPING